MEKRRQRDAEHDRLLAENRDKIAELGLILEKVRKEKEEIEKKFEENQIAVQDVVRQLHTKTNKNVTVMSIVLAVIGIVLACIHFFI